MPSLYHQARDINCTSSRIEPAPSARPSPKCSPSGPRSSGPFPALCGPTRPRGSPSPPRPAKIPIHRPLAQPTTDHQLFRFRTGTKRSLSSRSLEARRCAGCKRRIGRVLGQGASRRGRRLWWGRGLNRRLWSCSRDRMRPLS